MFCSEGGLGSIKIPLIADISKKMSSDYGVLVDDEEDDMYGAALRGLFIIDPSGKIRSIQVNDDQVGRNVEETLRLIRGFQHADKNGIPKDGRQRMEIIYIYIYMRVCVRAYMKERKVP